jgi:hypothetical protein
MAPIDEKIVWARPFVVPSSAGVGEEHETKMNIAPVKEMNSQPTLPEVIKIHKVTH